MSTCTLRPSVTAAPHLALVPDAASRLKRLAAAGASAKARGARGAARPPFKAKPRPTGSTGPTGPTVAAGDLGAQLPSEAAAARPTLKYDRRWATWRKDADAAEAVGLVAVIWADMRIEMEDLRLAPLMREMKELLCEQLGEEAVVSCLVS